ncbi:helix-turn-helix domain-containing protein [Hydrogenimonas thermophila]|uniref:helix-turn-helix domain-containing protein n=1 Tax=Hydrogenimonas thermophila TaxID=223786 RepID=UPI003742FF7B
MAEFAKYFNVSQRSLSAMEIGDRRVTYSFLNTLVEKFDVNPIWLFDDEAEPFKQGE